MQGIWLIGHSSKQCFSKGVTNKTTLDTNLGHIVLILITLRLYGVILYLLSFLPKMLLETVRHHNFDVQMLSIFTSRYEQTLLVMIFPGLTTVHAHVTFKCQTFKVQLLLWNTRKSIKLTELQFWYCAYCTYLFYFIILHGRYVFLMFKWSLPIIVPVWNPDSRWYLAVPSACR